MRNFNFHQLTHGPRRRRKKLGFLNLGWVSFWIFCSVGQGGLILGGLEFAGDSPFMTLFIAGTSSYLRTDVVQGPCVRWLLGPHLSFAHHKPACATRCFERLFHHPNLCAC